jgi:hypothetical protein
MANNNINLNLNQLDFSRIKSCLATRDMCIAVRQLGLWEFVRDYEDDRRGFMYSNNSNVHKIGSHPLVDSYGHSGSSFGTCCRNVQFIANQGLEAWCDKFEKDSH